ncbi:MAG: ATP-binding cassette domain-containing protein [Deltaproteobacteria bacterium]|nr:MAG: ATP-binding cassette domain-containing protein [Deltaproteobacteria bacterium]
MKDKYFIMVENITFSFDERLILAGISSEINQGETMVIFGPSGCGKSTLLKICAGIFPPQEGRVIINGIDINRASKTELLNLRKKMGFLFQDVALIANMNVYDNIAFPLRYHTDLDEIDIKEKVIELLKLVGVEEYKDLLPAPLSLGLKKRVGVARALVLEPNILFFDEPTADLDHFHAEEISRLIHTSQEKKDTTSIVVTNDLSFAYNTADRMLLIDRGKVVAVGSVEEIKHHPDPLIQQIISGIRECGPEI